MEHETARQWIHVGSLAFAFLLRFLTWWQAAVLAAVALVFNAFVLPRVGGRRLYRPIDEARGFPLGILLYPLAVLALILVFPSRLDIAAAAWAILALGDGMATLVGRAVAQDFSPALAGMTARTASGLQTASHAAFIRRPLPWNREKTVAGTLAFVVFGAAGGVALAWWTRPAIVPMPSMAFVVLAPILAAVAAALVETIPVRLDDNISVPITAGVMLWLATLTSPSALSESRDLMIARLPWAIGVNVVVSWLGHRAGTVTVSGAVGGAVIGAVIYDAVGPAGWIFLFVTFLAAAVASRLGMKRKVLLGIAEERGGRRGAANAFANCGIAAIAAVAAVLTQYDVEALLAFVAALTAGGSDTVASEIGKAWGRATFLPTTLSRVKPGTPGAMSLEGTAAGIVAALALAALGDVLGLISASAVPVVVVAATAGALVESALGATLEGPGILNNDMLNFINTAVAAAVALAIS